MVFRLATQYSIGYMDDIAVSDRRYKSFGEYISLVDKDIDALQQMAFNRKELTPQRGVETHQLAEAGADSIAGDSNLTDITDESLKRGRDMDGHAHKPIISLLILKR